MITENGTPTTLQIGDRIIIDTRNQSVEIKRGATSLKRVSEDGDEKKCLYFIDFEEIQSIEEFLELITDSLGVSYKKTSDDSDSFVYKLIPRPISRTDKRELFGTVTEKKERSDESFDVTIRTVSGEVVYAILSMCDIRAKVDGSNCCLSSIPGSKPWVQWFLFDEKTGKLNGYPHS